MCACEKFPLCGMYKLLFCSFASTCTYLNFLLKRSESGNVNLKLSRSVIFKFKFTFAHAERKEIIQRYRKKGIKKIGTIRGPDKNNKGSCGCTREKKHLRLCN